MFDTPIDKKLQDGMKAQTKIISIVIRNAMEDFHTKHLSDEQMKELMIEKAPCETGGVLLGTVFLYTKKVVITGLLPAPPDSIEKPTLFILGTEGLEKSIKNVEKKTNGKLTYLGTWHSHPYGGKVSQTDNNTYKKLLFVRNYEPTICLIVTQDEIILV